MARRIGRFEQARGGTLFLDEIGDMAAFHDPVVLGRILERDHPTFLLASAGDAGVAKTMESFPQFAPVFFDDVLVLYADAQAHPALVQRFRLEALHPVTWQKDDYETMGLIPSLIKTQDQILVNIIF